MRMLLVIKYFDACIVFVLRNNEGKFPLVLGFSLLKKYFPYILFLCVQRIEKLHIFAVS